MEPEAVRDDTSRKIDLFTKVKFNEPNKVGKRVYDDGKFINSLGDQIKLGKRLSDRQIAYLDKLLVSQPDSAEQALEITEYLVKSGNIDLIPHEIRH